MTKYREILLLMLTSDGNVKTLLPVSELPEYMALILRNGGSQSPDRWLRKPRNNQKNPRLLFSSRSTLTIHI